MSYRTTGFEGKLVSWGTGGNYYATIFSKFRVVSCRVSVTGEEHDISQLNSGKYECLAGMKMWTLSISAQAFGTPRLGNVGVVTLGGSQYAKYVDSWELMMETQQVHKITSQRTSAGDAVPVFDDWRPDGIKWGGAFQCGVDDTTPLTVPPDAGAAFPTGTFMYGDDSTDDTLAGAVYLRNKETTVERGQLNRAQYSFTGSGDLTAAGTNSIFPAGVITEPLWSQGGSAAGAVVVATKTGSRTLSGADSFWRSMRIACAVNLPVTLDIEVQGIGALTPA